MKLVTTLLTGVLVVGGLGAGIYAMTESQSTTTKTNPSVQTDRTEQINRAEKEKALDVTKGGQVAEIHLDDHGKKEYEMEAVHQHTEYEVERDAATGKVLKIEQDDHGHDEDNTLQTGSPKLSLDEAKKRALAQVKGTVTEAHLDDDDNPLNYEIKIKSSNNREAEVKVDATNGEILKVEIDD